MLILVSGPNGSGKSVFAEALAYRMSSERYYIATMICQNEENVKRIQKHRDQRADKQFFTIEEPYDLSKAQVSEGSAVLLEDVSNLLANVMFEKAGEMERVLGDILDLYSRCKVLIAVTIAGLSAEKYEGETAAYICALEVLNGCLRKRADVVVEMRDGESVCRKGELPDVI